MSDYCISSLYSTCKGWWERPPRVMRFNVLTIIVKIEDEHTTVSFSKDTILIYYMYKGQESEAEGKKVGGVNDNYYPWQNYCLECKRIWITWISLLQACNCYTLNPACLNSSDEPLSGYLYNIPFIGTLLKSSTISRPQTLHWCEWGNTVYCSSIVQTLTQLTSLARLRSLLNTRVKFSHDNLCPTRLACCFPDSLSSVSDWPWMMPSRFSSVSPLQKNYTCNAVSIR